MSKEKAASAGAWSALDIALRQGVQFVVSVILARLLTPADFGLIALLGFFISLSVTFIQGGLSMALVQRQDTTADEETAVVWCNLGASLVFGLIFIAIGPALAEFYEQPLLEPLMFVAAAQVALSALGAVQTALLTRSLRFDQLTKAGIVSSLASAAVGVGAAWAGWGVWALAAQLLSSSIVSTVALWCVSSWRPHLRMQLQAIRGLLRFGLHISASSVLEVIYTNGFLLVIGKAYSVSALGIWNRATSVTSFPTNIISQIIGRIALPLFSERASDREALRRGFRFALGLSMMVSLPLMVGLGVLSDLVVAALFGPKWAEAAPIMAVTVLSGALIPLQVLNLNLLLAIGDSRTFLRIEVWKKIYGILIVGTGCFFGLLGIAWSAFVISIVAYILNARPTGESIGYGPIQQIADLRSVFLSAAIMASGVCVLKTKIALSPWPALAVLSLAGALIYFLMLSLLKPPVFPEGIEVARSMLSKLAGRARRFG
jgi:O-antigen/teichoic acid export membrane protein